MDGTTVPTEADSPLVIHARRLRDEILAHPEGSWPEADRLLATAGGVSDHRAVAIVRTALASAARESQRYDEAEAHASGAVAAAQASADRGEQAQALAIRAMVRLERGDAEGARLDLRAAEAQAHLTPELRLAGAVVAGKSGESGLAREILEDLYEDPGASALVRMKAANNLAEQLLEIAPDRALALFRVARELASTESAVHLPFVEANIGIALVHLGDLPNALAAFAKAEAAQVRLSGVGMVAEYYAELSAVFGRVRLLTEARTAAAAALAGLPIQTSALMRADVLVTSARLAVADGDVAAARDLLTEAVQLYERQHRGAGMAISALEMLALDTDAAHLEVSRHAQALTDLGLTREAGRGWLQAGAAAERVGDLSAAEHYWQQVADHEGTEVTVGYEARARSALARGAPARAHREIVQALRVIDARAALASAPDLRHRIAADRAAFEVLLRRCAADDPPQRQLDAILLARPPAEAAAEQDLEHDEHRLQWRALARRVESADEDPATLIALGARLAEAERQLRATAWARGGARGGRPAYGLADLAAQVGCAILAIARTGDSATAFHHDAQGVTTAVVIGAWARLTDDLAQLTRGLTRVATGGRGSPAYAGTFALAMELNEQLAAVLPADNRDDLVVLLDRGLDSAPLTALPLLWPRAVRFASLAMTSAVVGRHPRPPQPRVLIAAGPRLEYAESEASAVARIWDAEGSGTRGPDEGAGEPPSVLRTAQAVRAVVADADVAHFAAHATLRWDNPLQSVIHLDDGPLALTELVALARPHTVERAGMRLLYLSACSLASAPTDDALIGAVPMLAERVAHDVVASSIPLPDAHAPAIAHAVHEALRAGLGAGTGLAHARLALGTAPEHTAARAALACLAAYTVVP